MYSHVLFFFFSSRRRHTRLQGDWSSDVCSSDLSVRGESKPQQNTEISSGVQREFCIDLTASSAVNLPMASASFLLVVVWIGIRSIRNTYSAARAPPRFTFTRNLVFFMGSLLAQIDRCRNNRYG